MNIRLMEYYRELKDYTYDKLSELSGIPKETVQRIFKGEITPDNETVKTLERLLKPQRYLVNYQEEPSGTSGSMVSEATMAYQAKKSFYTLEDYYALPGEQRVELIDGVFYNMS